MPVLAALYSILTGFMPTLTYAYKASVSASAHEHGCHGPMALRANVSDRKLSDRPRCATSAILTLTSPGKNMC